MDFIIIYPDICLRKANTQDNRENLNGNGRKEEYSPQNKLCYNVTCSQFQSLLYFPFKMQNNKSILHI